MEVFQGVVSSLKGYYDISNKIITKRQVHNREILTMRQVTFYSVVDYFCRNEYNSAGIENNMQIAVINDDF